VGGVALEVSLQGAILLGDGQFIIRLGEMVHTNINITGACQVFDSVLQQGKFVIGRGQG